MESSRPWTGVVNASCCTVMTCRSGPTDAGYKSLKAVLEGSISSPADNVLIYASSNRRHLVPEMKAENQEVHIIDGEIHPGEAVEKRSRSPNALACGCRSIRTARTTT